MTRRTSRKRPQRAVQDVHAALNLLARWLRHKPRTEAQARAMLTRRGAPPEVIEAALARARQMGWLNDAAFARLWVEERARLRPRARWVLAQELREKGIPERLIQQALETVDDTTLAQAALQQGLRRYGSLPWPEARKKLAAYLARRGFAYALIFDILTLWEAEHDLPTTPEVEERAT